MKRAPIPLQRGVSLVELLLALAVTAMLMAPVLSMLGTTASAGAATTSQRSLEQDANFALERIAARVRSTPRKRLDPNTLASDSESWFDARYSLRNGQLIERLSGTDRVIADNVAGFSITARAVGANNTLVETTLQLSQGANAMTATTVTRLGGPL